MSAQEDCWPIFLLRKFDSRIVHMGSAELLDIELMQDYFQRNGGTTSDALQPVSLKTEYCFKECVVTEIARPEVS